MNTKTNVICRVSKNGFGDCVYLKLEHAFLFLPCFLEYELFIAAYSQVSPLWLEG